MDWFSKVKSSFSGMIVGVLLFIGGSYLLWWNEGNAVALRSPLNDTQIITKVLDDINRLNPDFDGELVHTSGFADTNNRLTDPVFGISEKAIVLKRHVEYYQWTEQAKDDYYDGTDSLSGYTYSKKWVNQPIDSSEFRDPIAQTMHSNTLLIPLENLNLYSPHVTLGAYTLSDTLVQSIEGEQPLNIQLNAAVLATLNQKIRASYKSITPISSIPTQSKQKRNIRHEPTDFISVQGNTIYIGVNPSEPNIGDIRVTFTVIPATNISLTAKLNNDTFVPYQTADNQRIDHVTIGKQNINTDHGVDTTADGDDFLTWILRLAGTAIVIFGLKTLVAPLSAIAGIIPALGSIVDFGAGIVCFLVGTLWSFIIIGLAWIRFRSVIGMFILLGIIIVAIVLFFKKRSNKIGISIEVIDQ